ncbi:gamma-glutamyltransferase family protein [Pseudochelatococcus sp. B33]
MFTTRPEILGTFGAVASTHWLASSSGMAMLEKGGNAFDAAVAAGFVLQVVEPHQSGPAGDVPILFHSAATSRIEVICGQAPAPAGATIEHYKGLGLDLVPANGLLATVIPGAFDAWMLLLRDHGRLRLRDVLAPATYYASKGHPLLPSVAGRIAGLRELFEKAWPTSAAVYLPGGESPKAGTILRNEALGETWNRIVREAEAPGRSREAEIDAARDSFYRGFVAEAIERFVTSNDILDRSGRRHRGVIRAGDLAGWQARYEMPTTYDYGRYKVCKTGPWGQGPVFLQTLALLKDIDLKDMGPASAVFVHTLTEAMKLAFADRDAYYGDPDFSTVPLDFLLSDGYADQRRALIGDTASGEFRPGVVPGYEGQVGRTIEMLARINASKREEAGAEPVGADMALARRTAQAGSDRRGDTTHVDVVDSEGNLVSAMPSGGWLQSSPVIPELGFMLNSRAQMFWLEPGLPASLGPGKRPRTTLTPTLALRDGAPYMAFGSPGGDQQEQWALMLFLRHVHHGLNLQEAIDMPIWQTSDIHSSFYPRNRIPLHLLAEESFGSQTLEDLRVRGHNVEVAPAHTIGRLAAVSMPRDGTLRAGATASLMQAYAVGR